MKSILVTFIILAIQTLSALAQCFTEVQKYDSSDIETFFTRRFRLIKTVTIDYNAAADTTIRYYESYVEKSRLKYTFTDFGEGTSREFEVFCPGVTIAEFYPILQRLDKNFKMFNLKDSCKTIKKQKYYPQSKQYYTNEYIFKTKYIEGKLKEIWFQSTGIGISGYNYEITQINENTLLIKVWYWGT